MSERAQRPSLENLYGTLPDWAIKEFIKKGIIKIEPLPSDWEQNIGSVTVDFHLGGKILVPKVEKHTYIDVKRGVGEEHHDSILLNEGDPHVLMPGQFIVTHTKERLEVPDDIVARLEGKSSLARLGVVVHLTSGRFDPGWSDLPVLELKNNSDSSIIIYEGWPICAFSFDRLMSPVERPYTTRGRYINGTIHSLVHRDKS